jgi:ankyrin repeat protein
MLLKAGADVNAQGGHFGNALQAAAFKESSEVVQMLLKAGADVNAQGGYFGNALQAAAFKESSEVVQMLLKAGADVNAQGGHFGNALQAATAYEKSTEIFKLLLDAGADVNAQSDEGGPPILAAVQMSRFDRVSMLLHAGADVILADKLGQTPLHIAASKDMLDLLNQFPLLASAVNHRDRFLQTPLRVAISLGHIEFAMKLLRLGANPSLSDGYGRNALDWALGNKSLVHQIQMNCPSIVVTPHGNQELIVRQSILQITQVFFPSEPNDPWPLLRQLGCYLMFLNDLDNAGTLFQLPFFLFFITRRYIDCDVCKSLLTKSYFTCRICAHKDLCSYCAQECPCPSRLHPSQEHEMFEVLKLPVDKSELAISSPEQLTSFLSKVILEYSTPNTPKAETGSSDEPVSCLAPKKAALDSRTILSRKAMFYAFLFGLSAVLLRY